jgi:hypothetical protein
MNKKSEIMEKVLLFCNSSQLPLMLGEANLKYCTFSLPSQLSVKLNITDIKKPVLDLDWLFRDPKFGRLPNI